MEQPFAAVMVGLVLAALAVMLLILEYASSLQRLRRRPELPADDQPPIALRRITAAEVPGEVSRGMARLIGELRRAAAGR